MSVGFRRGRVPIALLLVAAGCATTAPPPGPPPGSTTARAPYDAPPATPLRDDITIDIDERAARSILSLLSKDHFDPVEAKLIEVLPAVKVAIRESNRPAETFERDLAAAFDEQTRIAMFDFRKIRDDRNKWDALLAALSAKEDDVKRRAATRAAALLPADIPVSVKTPIALTFGLPGRADHVLATLDTGERTTVIDLARALAEEENAAPPEQLEHLTRMLAADAYLRAWTAYRNASPAWQKHDLGLKQLEPLLREVAESGPVALYGVDQNFFPLSVWLKDRMSDSLDELNRVADRLVSTQEDLDQRVSLSAEVRRPDFVARIAAPAGAFLADGIIQTLGVDAYRAALAAGPRAFFEAYEKAQQQKGKQLIPLSKVIRDTLAGNTPSPKPPPKTTPRPS
ncbi:MAG TPA: hypothetical protein VGH97_15935 [Thermoanaerobaculia bacterium]|jgi:hypothetical protein